MPNDGVLEVNTGEDLLQEFVAGAHDGIILLDSRGTIIGWNPGEERITGISKAEALSEPIWEVQYRLVPEDLKSPATFAAMRAKALEALARGLDLDSRVEDRIACADGTLRILESNLFAIRHRGDIVTCAISRDVTEHRRLDDELRGQQAMLIEAERLARLGHWNRDLRTNSMTWSDEVYRILGHEPGTVPSDRQTFLDAVIPEDRERIVQALDAASREGTPGMTEYRIVRAGGEVRCVVGTVTLIRDSHGTPIRTVGTLQDITERQMMEQILSDTNRMKDEFFALLSHELRNPLAPISSGLHVLANAEPGGELARRMLAIIDRQVSHLTRIIDDLLDVQRLSHGKIKLRHELFDIGAAVRQSIEDHRTVYANADVELRAHITAEPLRIKADPTRVEQILGNLFMNAAKFTHRGGHVDVSVEKSCDSAVVHVRDDGIGIAPRAIDKLFEPFVQAETSLDRPKGGLGLGLSLVKQLVELHDGSVAARSEGLGHGTVFSVRFPLAARTSEAAVVPKAAERPSTRRVLIIEDNVDTAEVLKVALSLDGHTVQTRTDGVSGLELIRAEPPDVVLCDIGLPNIDGYEVARQVRADSALARVFLVALTGYALPQDVELAREAGFDRHVAKPPSVRALRAVLADAG